MKIFKIKKYRINPKIEGGIDMKYTEYSAICGYSAGKSVTYRYKDISICDVVEVEEMLLQEAVKETEMALDKFIKKFIKNNVEGLWMIDIFSSRPAQGAGIPWKQVGKRSYMWVIPTDQKQERGRRIDWGDQNYFYTKKEALNALYK